MKKTKREEAYILTFKGLVTLEMNMNEAKTDHFLDALELFLRRQDCNSVILTKAGGFECHKVYLEK